MSVYLIQPQTIKDGKKTQVRIKVMFTFITKGSTVTSIPVCSSKMKVTVTVNCPPVYLKKKKKQALSFFHTLYTYTDVTRSILCAFPSTVKKKLRACYTSVIGTH